MSPIAMSGPRSSGTPVLTLAQLVAKRDKLEDELRHVEKQVYDLETAYLHDASQCGNVLKGFESFLSSTKSNSSSKRPRKFQAEDRVFSLSSMSSPASEESNMGRDPEGRLEGGGGAGQTRLKGASTPAIGPGKHQTQQKRGRTAPRDGKRMRIANEYDDDDDELDAPL
eukprot:jgi/Mesen1/6309/ME000325S05434